MDRSAFGCKPVAADTEAISCARERDEPACRITAQEILVQADGQQNLLESDAVSVGDRFQPRIECFARHRRHPQWQAPRHWS